MIALHLYNPGATDLSYFYSTLQLIRVVYLMEATLAYSVTVLNFVIIIIILLLLWGI